MGTSIDCFEVALKLCDMSRVVIFANKNVIIWQTTYVSSMKKNLGYKIDRYIGYLEILRQSIIIRLGEKYGISNFYNRRSEEKFRQPEQILLLKIAGKDNAIYEKRPASQGVFTRFVCSTNFIFI